MKFFISAIASLLLSTTFGQFQGPNSCSNTNITAISGSNPGIAWNNVSNVSTSDNVYATFGNLTGISVGNYSDYLVCSDYGFSIPTGATIEGIVVEVERADNLFKAGDYSIKIVKNNVICGTDQSTGQTFPFSDSYQSFGGASDLWGATWTVADINSPDFGVALSVQRKAASGTSNGRIDHIRIFVFYSITVLAINDFSFKAIPTNKIVQLSWTTVAESNMKLFEVERSVDGALFSSIHSVESKNGPALTAYSVNDEKPITGKAFYRIKSVYNNGSAKYSRIITVNFKPLNDIQLYPNPWKQGTKLYVNNPTNEKLQLLFFDNSGKLVYRQLINPNNNFIDAVAGMKTGLLFFKAINTKNELRGAGTLLVTD